MAIVHMPDETDLRAAGWSVFAGVPMILLRDHTYPRSANLYLRERVLGIWHPQQPSALTQKAFGKTARYWRPRTIVAVATHLGNFLEWAKAVGLCWRAVDSVDLERGYGRHMANGQWSAEGRPLSKSTVAVRLSCVAQFLQWAHERGRSVKKDKRIVWGRGQSNPAAVARYSTVRRNPVDLMLPRADEVELWLSGVKARFGATKALMCELIISTGLRREEAALWPLRHLVRPENELRWIGQNLVVEIWEGTKGDKARQIYVPTKIVAQLIRYQKFRRQVAVATSISQPVPKTDGGRLFLSEKDGGPVSAQSLYNAWTTAPNQPYAGWTPHLGRHYWACQTLLTHLQLQSGRIDKALTDMPHAWIDEVGRSVIETVIQPQLGHRDVSTTDRYLRWLHHATIISENYIDYHKKLDML